MTKAIKLLTALPPPQRERLMALEIGRAHV